MNSIAIIIILMISLIGIGIIFWIRSYYDVNTRTVDKIMLKKSVTNILSSDVAEASPQNPNYSETSSQNLNYSNSTLENENEDGYYDSFSQIDENSQKIGQSIKNAFHNRNNDESKLQSLKTAINDTINTNNNTNNETITPIKDNEGITPTFVNVNEENEIDYTKNNIEEPPISPKTNVNMNEIEESSTNPQKIEIKETDKTDDIIYTEYAETNNKFRSAEEEVKEAINKNDKTEENDNSDTITPIHSQEDEELLNLYRNNETLTPYKDFEYKDPDQKKIENVSNKIDKFYERLSDISLNKISRKNKKEETNTNTPLSQNDNNYTQTVFKTEGDNIRLSNETNNLYNSDDEINEDVDGTITPITSPRKNVNKRVGLKIKIKIDNEDVELKTGDTVIFNYNNETYSSKIIDLRPDEIYVNYRRNRVWISPNSVKKKFE